jgi:hypothetical protein
MTARRLRRLAIVAIASLALFAQASAQQIPALIALSAAVTAYDPELATRRAALMQERTTLHADIERLNARCAAIEAGSASETACKSRQAALVSALKAHIRKSNDFNAAVQAAMVASRPADQPAADLDPDSLRVLNGIEALARRWGWDANKLARLDRALRALDFGQDPDWSGARIRRVWQDMLARSGDAELVREASQDGGLGFAGAGTQIDVADCTIFALANAAGVPYGGVAARAAELIRQASWRSSKERSNPQGVIEESGLNGGEMVLLAEVFGRADVVPPADFAKTLMDGHPVLVGVVGKSGDTRFGHQVVLTKTFQHGRATWYVMIDSYQGPQRPLFVSADELNAMLRENGVAFRPNPGVTPRLLRKDGDP